MGQHNLAIGRLIKTGDAVERRRFTGAIGADNRRDVIAMNIERYRINSR
jgi:hypothetical protein